MLDMTLAYWWKRISARFVLLLKQRWTRSRLWCARIAPYCVLTTWRQCRFILDILSTNANAISRVA